MKNILRVTAIILTMAATLVAHPFLRLEAKVFERPIKMDRVINNSTYPHASISYTYGVDGAAGETFLHQGNPDMHGNVGLLFFVDINISFDEPCYCQFRVDYIRPEGPASDTFIPEYIAENCRVLTHTKDATVVRVDNQQFVKLRYCLTYDSLYNHFGYWYDTNTPDPLFAYTDGQMWIEAGYDFLRISNFSYTNYVSSVGLDDISEELNQLLNYVDTVESNLTSLVSTTSTLSSNIVLNRKLDHWTTGAISSQNNAFNAYFFEYIYNNTGPSRPNTRRTWYLGNGSNFNNNARVNIPVNNGTDPMSGPTWAERQNLKIIIFFKNIDAISNVYYLNLPYTNQTDTKYTSNLYMYSQLDNYIYKVEVANTLDYDYTTTGSIQISLQCLNLSSLSVLSLTETTYIDSVYITAEPITTEQLLQHNMTQNLELIEAIKNMSINVTNNEVNNIVNDYDVNINNVYNIENNISTDLNTQMQQFTPDNSNIIQRLDGSSILLKSVITQINGIELFTIPIAVALVGVVLIAILG